MPSLSYRQQVIGRIFSVQCGRSSFLFSFFLQYVLNSCCLCNVCECESTLKNLLKKRNFDKCRTLLHCGNTTMSTQQEDDDGKKGVNG